jgi:hypothetical protein
MQACRDDATTATTATTATQTFSGAMLRFDLPNHQGREEADSSIL